MEWLFWAVLSALFAGATALLAKIGVADINSNLATAIRTTVILLFSWIIALATTRGSRIRVDRKENMDFPCSIRDRDRAFLALLFSGTSGGRGFQGGSDR